MKKKTYLQPKRCRRFLGPFLHFSSYDAGSVACAFCSSPILVVPLIMCCCCFCCVMSLFVPVPVVNLWWCPPHCLSLSPGPHHCCCYCHLSPCCQCQCHPVPLFLLSWLPFFFIVASFLSSPCQLFPPHEQLLTVMGCWWQLASLPRHSLCPVSPVVGHHPVLLLS